MPLSQQDLTLRATGIGASETAALLGLDPYRGPLDIYLRKLGLAESVETHHTRRGQYLENGLRRWAADVIGVPFGPAASRAMPGNKLVLATPDGEAPTATLEIKSPGPRTWHEWGEGDEAPDRYVIQVAQQMLVTGAPAGYLAALLGDDLRVYRYERDSELESSIIETIERFWHDHIEAQVPPAPTGTPNTGDWIKQRFARARGPLLPASGAIEDDMIELHAARAALKAAELREEAAKQRIQVAIGDAEGVESPVAGKIIWRNNKDGTKTEWESVARAAGATPEQIAEHTHNKPGPRVFRVYPPKER